jgi:adenosine deaminase
MGTVMAGFERAIAEARDGWGQSVTLILSFLRHLPEEDCLAALDAAEPFREQFTAIGLASSERDFPPANFQRLYAAAAAQGYALTAHAGEEGPPAFIVDALDLLGVTRIDHGVRATEDAALLQRLAAQRTALTVCPLSNVRLCVYEQLADHPLLALLEQGIAVTVNSDDPAYFGGYLLENFAALERELSMNAMQAEALVRNSFEAAFLGDEARAAQLSRLEDYLSQNPAP